MDLALQHRRQLRSFMHSSSSSKSPPEPLKLNPMASMFIGEFATRTVCLKCGGFSPRKEEFSELRLNVQVRLDC